MLGSNGNIVKTVIDLERINIIWLIYIMPSNGSFWYGQYGFLYKKNTGVGAKRSTKMAAGGNVTCNQSQYLYNKYSPGQSGIGAQSTAVRRAKNHRAVLCGGPYGPQPNRACGQFYNYLGLYNRYLYNPNGYFVYPPSPPTPL